MKKVKTVVFDFFDVLHRDYQKAWLAANGLTRSGPFAESSDLLDIGQITYAQYLERYAQACGKTAGQIHQEFQQFAQLDEEVVAVARNIKSLGLKVGLVSNAGPDEIRPILDGHRLRPIFDTVIISGEVGVCKPDPAIFRLALDRLSAQPGETAFVDDNPDNVKAARGLGIHGIHHTGIEALQNGLRLAGVNITN